MHNVVKSFLVMALLLVTGRVLASENRFNLIDQNQFWGNRGFCLTLTGGTAGGRPSFENLKLTLKVGDGKNIRSLLVDPTFAPGISNSVNLKIDSRAANLTVNGHDFVSRGGFVPSTSDDALIAETDTWTRARGDYRILEDSYSLSVSTTLVQAKLEPKIKGQLALFEFPLPVRVKFFATEGQLVTFETSFRVQPFLAKDLAGAVDRYGQASAADWPGKVRTDQDIKDSIKQEQDTVKGLGNAPQLDPYGGTMDAWHDDASGFFRVSKRGGVWWLISPAGHPLFYTGLCSAPTPLWDQTPVGGRESIFKELPPKVGEAQALWAQTNPWDGSKMDYLALHSWNLVRKFGSDWKQQAITEGADRIRQWGFSGEGKFCEKVTGLPRVVTIWTGNLPKLVGHLDPFDPVARDQASQVLAKDISPQDAADPYIVGFSVGNEFEQIVTLSEIKEILAKHAESPASKAIRVATTISPEPTPAELEKARQFYADAYYDFIYKSVKSLAPHHIYLGFWITPGWWENEADWDLIARHCDVIGYDMYSPKYGGRDVSVTKLEAHSDKPTIVGEFSSPPWYGGNRGVGWYTTYSETEADSGKQYSDYLLAGAADPMCIGAMYFQYRDEPVSGRGDSGAKSALDLVIGENFAFGFVDVTDRPKWDFVIPARRANLDATAQRLKLRIGG